MDTHAPPDFEAPLFGFGVVVGFVIIVGALLLQLGYATGVLERPPPPHPCEIWQMTDPGLDLEKCYKAFEATGFEVSSAPASGQ